jgi:predicted transposase YdaD
MTDKTTQKRPADKALEIAKEMLAKGFDVETIMEITGLDKETVLMLGKSA